MAANAKAAVLAFIHTPARRTACSTGPAVGSEMYITYERVQVVDSVKISAEMTC